VGTLRRRGHAIENKPRTIAHKRRLWRQRIKPAIGRLRINDVTEQDAGAIVRAPLRLDANGKVVAGKAAAGDLYRLVHHLFRKALGWGLRAKEAGNPLENVCEPKVARRERLFAGSEVGALVRALDAAADDGTVHPQIIAAIRAAVFTGCRISELLTLGWQDIHRDGMTLRLSDTKTGFSERPISADALAVLDGVKRMPGVEYVFRGVRNPTAPLAYRTTATTFRRLADKAGGERCTLHTLRHWFATITANAVSNPRVGMALTGHRALATYMGYLHAHKDQTHALADQLGRRHGAGQGRAEHRRHAESRSHKVKSAGTEVSPVRGPAWPRVAFNAAALSAAAPGGTQPAGMKLFARKTPTFPTQRWVV
jgi:integrase